MTKRADVPMEDQWDLSDLCRNEEDYKTGLKQFVEDAADFTETYKGRISTAESPRILLKAYLRLAEIMEKSSPVLEYAFLDVAADITDPVRVRRSQEADAVLGEINGELSFFQSELNLVPEDILKEAMKADDDAAAFFGNVLRDRPHRFGEETERVLSSINNALFGLPATVYSNAKLADLRFPDFEVNGVTYPLTFALYEEKYAYDPNTDLRRKAFRVFSDTLAHYRNTIAAGYFANVQTDLIMGRLRKFDSVFSFLLHEQQVSRAVYERQINVIMENLAPHMRRYAQKIRENWGLDKITYADLKLPPKPGMDTPVTCDEARSIIYDTLGVMGNDYRDLAMRAFDERWFDFAANEGKSTGGFCAQPYGRHAYILLNWNGLMADVFTMIHELGHACQGMLSQQEHHFFSMDPTMYIIEAPSTFHETLLNARLLSEAANEETKSRVAGMAVANTYYHNFVTHFLEAAWQYEVYKRAEEGEMFTADDFDTLFMETLRKFWGDSIELTDGAERTWMRQPHYYNGLYSYTYSASLTVSTAVSRRLEREGNAVVRDWLRMLRMGGTKTPAELALSAGVDITTNVPLEETIAWIGELIDLI